MAESASGEDEASVGYPSGLNLPILPARDFLRWSRRKTFSFWPYDIFSIDQACSVSDSCILPSFVFALAFLLASTSSRSIKGRKELGKIPSHHDLTPVQKRIYNERRLKK